MEWPALAVVRRTVQSAVRRLDLVQSHGERRVIVRAMIRSAMAVPAAMALAVVAWAAPGPEGAAADLLSAQEVVQAPVPAVQAQTVAAVEAPAPPVAVAAVIPGIGRPVDARALDAYRGGTGLVVNDMRLRGVVADNTAIDVTTGSNMIRDGAFAHMNGIPTVVQNTGANVLIQSATIVNVQFQAP